MCEPVTLGAIAAGSALAAGGVSAYGAVKAGNYNAKVAENNAKLMDYKIKDAKARGQNVSAQLKEAGSMVKGAQVAAMATSGIDSGSGSYADVLASTDASVAADVAVAKNNTLRAAWGFETERQNIVAGGEMAKYSGLMTGLGSAIGGAGGALATFGNIAGPSLFPKTGG